MQVEVFSDVVCPFCYIGKRRLEEALSSFPHADDVQVTYRSFQLDPTTPQQVDEPHTEALARKYGVSVEQARAMDQRVSDMAATVGLDFHLEDAHPANTFDAHRLLHLAAQEGRQEALKERLLRAYFTDGARIGDHAELAALAVEAGLDPERVREVLAGNEFGDQVRADIELARAFGATGVPFFVFDRKYGVSGAQETAVFTDVLDRAWADAHPAPLTAVGNADAAACEGDACEVPQR